MSTDVRAPRTGMLDRILTEKRAEIARMLADPALRTGMRPRAGLPGALARPRPGPLHLVTEIKLRSPSAGDLSRALSPADRALAYARAGASMISVLTDAAFFGGSFDDLAACREALDRALGDARPHLLCKEFVLHPIQLDRAVGSGADAVLLIVRCLTDPELPTLVREAEARGLAALVEVTTPAECARAIDAGARMIGVNARDLDTLAMDAARAATVLASLGAGVVAVHLSGLRGPDDVKQVAAGRADAALIGEALMREDDPSALLTAMRRAAG